MCNMKFWSGKMGRWYKCNYLSCHSYPLSVSRAAKWWQARLRKMGSKWLHEFIGWSVLVPYNLSPNPIYGLSAPKTDPFFVFIETRTWSLIQWEINIMRGQSHSLPQFHWYIFNHLLPLKRPHNHKKEVLNNFSRKRGVIMFPNDLNFHDTKKPFYINLKVNFFF